MRRQDSNITSCQAATNAVCSISGWDCSTITHLQLLLLLQLVVCLVLLLLLVVLLLLLLLVLLLLLLAAACTGHGLQQLSHRHPGHIHCLT
jgi:hypothetical protein